MRLVDRSRVITHQLCQRKRFLNYEYKGIGIQRDALNKDLFVGICTHRGLETLLLGLVDYKPYTEGYLIDVVEIAVRDALKTYDEGIAEQGFDDDNDPTFSYLELRSLVEALIRVYAKVQLPKLLEEYEILEVEKEIEFELVPSMSTFSTCTNKDCFNQYNTAILKCPECNSVMNITYGDEAPCDNCKGTGSALYLPSKYAAHYESYLCQDCKGSGITGGIVFMSRPDAILRRKKDGAIVVLSYKTSSTYDTKINELQNQYDMQGISEAVAVEKWLWSNANSFLKANLDAVIVAPKVHSIKMEFLIKGQRIGKGINKGWTNNALIHPWKNEMLGELAEEYESESSGIKKRLGKGWIKINIWEEGEDTLKQWIDHLYETNPNFLRSFIVTPDNYLRNDDDIQEWLISTIAQEQEIQRKLEEVPLVLEAAFIKHRGACFSYNHKCSFWEICWRKLDPNCQEFIPRVPHHQRELELYQITKE